MIFPQESRAQIKDVFAVTPGILHLDLAKTRPTETFTVKNTGKERIRVSIKPVYFPLESPKLNGGTSLESFEKGSDNIVDSLLVSPKILSLKPNQKRRVRLALRKNRKFITGDYRAHLLITTLEKKQRDYLDEQKKEPGSNNVGMQLGMKLEVAIAIYARSGIGSTDLTWGCGISKESGKPILTVINPSPFRYKGWFGLFPKKSDSDPFIKQLVISLRESRRVIQINPKSKMEDPFIIRWGVKKQSLSEGEFLCSLPSS